MRPRPLALAIVALLLGAACGGATVETEPGGASGDPSPPSSSASPTEPPDQGGTRTPDALPEVLDFEAPLVGGGTFRGEDLAGKDVAFWFWAPW